MKPNQQIYYMLRPPKDANSQKFSDECFDSKVTEGSFRRETSGFTVAGPADGGTFHRDTKQNC